MAQTRYWNFQDDDVTIGLDEWFHGIILPGVYQGFDFGVQDSMMLHLVHNITGSRYVKQEPPALSNYIGVLRTKQCVVVQEDAGIDIPISAADPTNPRIDLIYISHEYIDSKGGQPAFYGIIQGTPGVNPVTPELANDLTDLIIATIYIPAAITDLTDDGVIYTRAEVPTIANENYANRDKVNRYTRQAQEAPIYNLNYGDFNTSTKTLNLNTESNYFQLPANVDTTAYLQYILNDSADGTEVTLRVITTNGITVKHDASFASNSIFNEVDQEDIFIPLFSELYFQKVDGYWLLKNYSLQSVWQRTNAFKKAQQFPYGTGVSLNPITYVVSSVTYNTWMLEIDASAQNHVLDLSNSSQMNGFNLLTNSICINFINIIPGFKTINSGLGNGTEINIKVIGATGILLAFAGFFPPPAQTGTYLYLDNAGDIGNMSIANSGGFNPGSAINLAEILNTTNSVSEFTIKINIGNKFSLTSINSLLKSVGNSIYSNNNFYTNGTSHKDAIDTLANQLTTSVGSGVVANVVLVQNLSATIVNGYNFTQIGKLFIVSFKLIFTYNAGGGLGQVRFDLPQGLIPKQSSGVLGYFSCLLSDGTIATGQYYQSSSTKMEIDIQALNSSGSVTAYCEFTAIYPVN